MHRVAFKTVAIFSLLICISSTVMWYRGTWTEDSITAGVDRSSTLFINSERGWLTPHFSKSLFASHDDWTINSIPFSAVTANRPFVTLPSSPSVAPPQPAVYLPGFRIYNFKGYLWLPGALQN